MYKKQKRSWVKHLDFTILDILCIQIAYCLAYFVRFRSIELPYMIGSYKGLAIIMILLQICVIFFSEPYKDILRRDRVQEFKKTIISCSFVSLSIIVYIYTNQLGEVYSRTVLGLLWIFSVPICYIVRILWKSTVRKAIQGQKKNTIMILLTNDEAVERCIINFEHDPYRTYVIKGIVIMDKNRKGDVIREVPVVANADDFLDYIRTNVVDEVFINGNNLNDNEQLARELLEMGVTVHFKLLRSSGISENKVIETYAGYTVLTTSINMATPRQMFIKRVMDIVGSVVGLFFMLIAFVIFAPIIKIQSPGPVFFKQPRVGRNGRRFNLYKFRSMYNDAEERKKELMDQNKIDGNMFKLDNDPRVTPIGRFMRKYSIDELPQFWNVLKGEMSLVGTRPPTEDEFELYQAHHRARLGIKPGITGMWQVSGRSDITNFEEVVALDTQYISNWNLSMDLRILFKTIMVVIKGQGAS